MSKGRLEIPKISRKMSWENVLQAYIDATLLPRQDTDAADKKSVALYRKVSDFLFNQLSTIRNRSDFIEFVVLCICSAIKGTQKWIMTDSTKVDIKYVLRGVNVYEKYQKILTEKAVDGISFKFPSEEPFMRLVLVGHWHVAFLAFDTGNLKQFSKCVRKYNTMFQLEYDKNYSDMNLERHLSDFLSGLLNFKSSNFDRALNFFDKVLRDKTVLPGRDLEYVSIVVSKFRNDCANFKNKCQKIIEKGESIGIDVNTEPVYRTKLLQTKSQIKNHAKNVRQFKKSNEKRKEKNVSCEFCKKGETIERRFMVCSRCKTVRYCSKDCQKRDWKAHKKICKKPSKNE